MTTPGGSLMVQVEGQTLPWPDRVPDGPCARQLYLLYGVPRWISGTLPTDVTFTGQRDLAGINLMHYKARFYSDSLGRFLSADTIVPKPGNPQALNRYSYVNNRPSC